MLGDEAGPKHLEALSRDLLDYRGIVQKPPAAERHEVAEFSCVNAKLVLVLAAEYADQETILRKLAAHVFQCAQVGLAQRIARQAQLRVDLTANADHEGQRN